MNGGKRNRLREQLRRWDESVNPEMLADLAGFPAGWECPTQALSVGDIVRLSKRRLNVPVGMPGELVRSMNIGHFRYWRVDFGEPVTWRSRRRWIAERLLRPYE